MPSKLHNPQQALGDYLNDMLHQATAEPAGSPVVDADNRMLLPAELLTQPPGGQAVESQALRPQSEPDDETAQLVEADQTCAAQQAPDEFPMQCLMFRVGRHLLSVPLIRLCSVVNWNEAITRLPESPDWLLGLVKHRDMNLRIVDSHLLLNIAADGEQAPEHLLVLDEGNWAITCDRLEQVVNLEYDDIQWKPDNAQHLVLGTIRDSLSTLLNPPGIVESLNSRNPPRVDV